jgi:hypothetical protein
VGESAPTASPVTNFSQFRSIAGALQYLTFTQPDIAYVVQQICLHMHDPREPHLTNMKRILHYLRGTPDFGLLLRHSSSSTSGYAIFLGDNLVSWSAKRQTVVSCSSVEAEYRAVANGVAAATWLR